jgi:hypothetical protein
MSWHLAAATITAALQLYAKITVHEIGIAPRLDRDPS